MQYLVNFTDSHFRQHAEISRCAVLSWLTMISRRIRQTSADLFCSFPQLISNKATETIAWRPVRWGPEGGHHNVTTPT